MIDILPEHLKIIKDIFARNVPDCEVRIFGSRIKGTAKSYSDLDIVIVSDQKIARRVMVCLKEEFEESVIPFRVEVLDWNDISEEFKKVITEKYEILQK